MEKRALLAVVLSLGFFYLYSMLFPAPEHKDLPKPQQKPVSSAQLPVAAPVVQVQQSVPQTPVAAREVVVNTDLFTAVFTNQGGALKRFVLKKYRETAAPGGVPVSLVSQTKPDGFTLKTQSAGFGLNPLALYAVADESLKVSGADKKKLEFVWSSPQGVLVRKIYTFTGDSYAIGMELQLANTGSSTMSGTLDLVLPHPIEPKDNLTRFEVNNAVTLADESFTATSLKKLADKPEKFTTNIAWTGYADKYFLGAVISEANSINSVLVQKGSPDYIDSTSSTAAFQLQPGQSRSVAYRLFFGPKDLDVLNAQGAGLEQSLDLGWFSAIAKPLLYALKFLYKYTHNYGIAIIIITIIIKIIFFPLTHKSYKSMKDMQKLQPKMNELKEKHKDDRDAMNRAIMELYRTHKVNPLGGCLPMLVQIPVFFALYKALMFSIELRHAPFYFWITDLSAKDPYYITPIVMGATMFIQQKMTPTSMDPMQAKIMLALPVVFTFMFLNFPSGLVIYWLVNNLLTIGQQAYINSSLKEA